MTYREREIEEIRDIILKTSEQYYQTRCSEECALFEAIDLYDAGYRKQSETARPFDLED